MLGGRYLFSWELAPVCDLAMDSFDEDAIRATARCVPGHRGCRVEAIMKDNNTIRDDPSRVIRWVRMAREEAESL